MIFVNIENNFILYKPETMNKFLAFVVAAVLSGGVMTVTAQTKTQNLRKSIAEIAKENDGKLGVGVINFNTGDTLTYNGDELFPMAQLGNLPVGLLTLNIVDKQGGTLKYKVPVKASELQENAFCPLLNKYPNGDTEIALNDLVAYMIGFDDENATDILTRQIGGLSNVNQFLAENNVRGMKLNATQKDQNANYQRYYDNYSTPYAMLQLLRAYNSGKIINGNLKGYFNSLLQQVPAGTDRIRSGLPENVSLAHKTGSSQANAKGTYAATNDVGIFNMPNGDKVGLVVFLKDSKKNRVNRDRIIADVTKAVWADFQ